ncbi:integrase, catalytic region, zinc finger, CCHC-type containing protein, partial [Tanacetum coccineum]
ILKGSRGTNLYTISFDEMMKSSPICLMSKASKSKSWLWHRRLNHLNFGTINDLARKDLVRGLLELISKKKTKNEAKTTKPDSEWKSRKRQSQSPSPSLKKSTESQPKSTPRPKVKKYKFRD